MARTRREFIKTTAAAGAMFGAVGAPRLEAQQMGNRVHLPTPRAKALMEMFGLKYPIFEAPDGPQTSPELAIAVSNAGAMGALASLDSPELARESGDAIATKTDGSKILRYQAWSPVRGFGGAVTECPMWAGQSVEFVNDLPAAGELVDRLWRESESAEAGANSAK